MKPGTKIEVAFAELQLGMIEVTAQIQPSGIRIIRDRKAYLFDNFQHFVEMQGEKVIVGFNPDHAEAGAFILKENRQFVCIAQQVVPIRRLQHPV